MDKIAIREFSILLLINLALVSIFSLFSFGILLFVVNLIIAIYVYKRDLKWGVLLYGATSILALVIDFSLILFVLMLASSLVVGLSIRRKRYEESIFFGLLTAIASFSLMLLITKFVFNYDIVASLSADIKNFEFPPELLAGSGLATGAFELQQLKSFILKLIPSMIVMVSLIYVSAIYFLVVFIVKRMDKDYVGKSINQFYLPGKPLMGTTLMILVAMLLGTLLNDDIFIINTLYIVMMIFAFNGIAALFFILDRMRTKGILKFVLGIVMILFLQMLGLSILGWLDQVFKLRKKAA